MDESFTDVEQIDDVASSDPKHLASFPLSSVDEQENNGDANAFGGKSEKKRALNFFESEKNTAVDDLGSAKPSLEENTLFSWLYSATSNQESKKSAPKRRESEELNTPVLFKRVCSIDEIVVVSGNNARTSSNDDSLSLSLSSNSSPLPSHSPRVCEQSMPLPFMHARRPAHNNSASKLCVNRGYDEWVACIVDDTRDQTQPRQIILEPVLDDCDISPQLRIDEEDANEDRRNGTSVPFSLAPMDKNNNSVNESCNTDETISNALDAFFPVVEQKRVVCKKNELDWTQTNKHKDLNYGNFGLNRTYHQLRLSQIPNNIPSMQRPLYEQFGRDTLSEICYQTGLASQRLLSYSMLPHLRNSNFVPAATHNLLTYDNCVQRLPSNIQPTDKFCLVPGRLGMPSQCKTHEVTVGEILRRVLKPESLNVSLLGPILRKAKSKHGSHHLRLRLQQIGVDLPVGRRKTAQCSLFTSLTESEAGQLADDYQKLCDSNIPTEELASRARSIFTSIADSSSEEPATIFKYVIALLDLYIELIVQSSSSHQGDDDDAKDLEQKLYNFKALTHGFGIGALTSSLKTFRVFVEVLSEQTHGSKD